MPPHATPLPPTHAVPKVRLVPRGGADAAADARRHRLRDRGGGALRGSLALGLGGADRLDAR
eukprot:1272022-Prymnesium_polylepis.1